MTVGMVYLFILSRAGVRHHALVGDVFDVLTEDAVACIRLLILRYVVTAVVCKHFILCLKCASVMFLYFDVRGVFIVVECSLFLSLGCG